MAHQVSANSFRLGKTFLWSNNLLVQDNKVKLINKLNNSKGIELALSSILKKHKIMLIKSIVAQNPLNGCLNVKFLYYPFFYTNNLASYKSSTVSVPKLSKLKKFFLNKSFYFTEKEKGALKKIWKVKQSIFLNRFVSTKKRKNFNKLLVKSFLRGSVKIKNYGKFKTYKKAFIKKNNTIFKGFDYNLKRTQYRINKNALSYILSKKIGQRVYVKPLNVFNYYSLKLKKLNFNLYKQIFFKKYFRYYRRNIKYFFDFINLFILLCFLPNISNVLIKLIQHSLEKMHKKKIQPKYFFYFIDSLLKRIPVIRSTFSAFRIIITGKLRGGTARTKSFSSGFGVLSKQTLSKNIIYDYGNVESKYGSFGIKLLASKK